MKVKGYAKDIQSFLIKRCQEGGEMERKPNLSGIIWHIKLSDYFYKVRKRCCTSSKGDIHTKVWEQGGVWPMHIIKPVCVTELDLHSEVERQGSSNNGPWKGCLTIVTTLNLIW